MIVFPSNFIFLGWYVPTQLQPPFLPLCLQGAAKENTVSGIFDTQISRPINSGILHWKRENWLEPEDKEFAIWEAQGSNVPTNAEVWLQKLHCLPQLTSQFYDREEMTL